MGLSRPECLLKAAKEPKDVGPVVVAAAVVTKLGAVVGAGGGTTTIASGGGWLPVERVRVVPNTI